MKPIWFFRMLILTLSVTGISAAEIPDLVGEWTCSGSGYSSEAGYFEEADVSNLIFSIEEQDGRLFTGNFTYEENGTAASEAFAGAIGADNRTYYIVYASGLDWFNVGTIISEDEIDQMYMQISEPGQIFIDRLYRTVEYSAESAFDLTGKWGEDSANVYITQVDDTIWWYAEDPAPVPAWTSVAYGVIEGSTVSVTWVDVPKAEATIMGTAVLNVTSDDELQLVDQTGGFGGKDWEGFKLTRIDSVL